MAAAIVIKEGPLAGRRVELNGELVVGREDVSLPLQDPELSRRHAIIRPVAGGAEIEDLGSLNGTFVNSERIEVPTRIGSGDTIKVGNSVLVLEAGIASATVVAPSPAERPAAMPVTPSPAETPAAMPAMPVTPSPAETPAAMPAMPVTPSQAETPAAAMPVTPSPTETPAVTPVTTTPTPGLAPGEPFGTYAAPVATGRRGGIASRQLMPLLLSWAAVVSTGAGLALYFALR